MCGSWIKSAISVEARNRDVVIQERRVISSDVLNFHEFHQRTRFSRVLYQHEHCPPGLKETDRMKSKKYELEGRTMDSEAWSTGSPKAERRGHCSSEPEV